MNLATHFQSYRESVLADSVPELSWYAKNRATKSPTWPTVYDYTTFTLQDIKLGIERNHRQHYEVSLLRHQQAMIAIFEAMVEEELWGYNNLKGEDILRMIDNRGPKWFKFCKKAVELTIGQRMVWIPRFSSEFAKHCVRSDCRVVSADELPLLREQGHAFFEKERRRPANADLVQDWSLPLFGGTYGDA